MKTHPLLTFLLLGFIASTVLPDASAQFGNLLKKDTKKNDASAEMEEEMGDYNGVKHAIGVTDFENEAGWRGQWELGANMAMMLESALFDSGRFVIVERAELGDVVMEQDLQSSGRAAESSEVAQTGLIQSAKYIATGTVTRVDTNTSGDSGGFAIKGLRIGGGSNRADIELVVKLIDTTSSQVVASRRIEGTAGGSKINIGFSKRGLSGNLGGFAKTPLGEAAQDCISEAVKFIATSMEDFDITANVVLARSESMIVINRGEDYGVSVGDVFAFRETGEILTDPATGAILEVFEGKTLGRVKVDRVSEKVSYCSLVDGQLPSRGDNLIFQK